MPRAPTTFAAYCSHDPGRQPRSSTRCPARSTWWRASISSSLKTERATKPAFLARAWNVSCRCLRSRSFDNAGVGYFLLAAAALEAFIGFFDFSSSGSWRLRLYRVFLTAFCTSR